MLRFVRIRFNVFQLSACKINSICRNFSLLSDMFLCCKILKLISLAYAAVSYITPPPLPTTPFGHNLWTHEHDQRTTYCPACSWFAASTWRLGQASRQLRCHKRPGKCINCISMDRLAVLAEATN